MQQLATFACGQIRFVARATRLSSSVGLADARFQHEKLIYATAAVSAHRVPTGGRRNPATLRFVLSVSAAYQRGTHAPRSFFDMSGADQQGNGRYGRRLVACATFAAACLAASACFADEGGVSFWLPGLFGSLAAVPATTPGWSFSSFYYHTSVTAGPDVATAREITIGRFKPDAEP